jgi:hypothetical protein
MDPCWLEAVAIISVGQAEKKLYKSLILKNYATFHTYFTQSGSSFLNAVYFRTFFVALVILHAHVIFWQK